MAEEKKIPTKAELRATAESLVKDYNDAIQGGKYDIAVKLNEKIDETVNEYTSIAREECFNALKATEDPMMEAVKTLVYPTIRAKDTKQGDEKIPVRVLEDVEKPIDLLKLHKFVGGDGIGKDENWSHLIEKLNYLLTCRKAAELGVKPTKIIDNYAMSDIAKKIDMGETPYSKTALLKALQTVVTAMIGAEYKVSSHDVGYLTSVYSRKNRVALTVSCANHKYMRQYMAEICHRIVLGKSYDLEYKKIKQ